MPAVRSNSRIVVVDCLRGFALFGLFIVHMVEYFELFWYAPEWGWVHDTVFFLFGGKAYAIFALLFGLSFFIMMDNQARRGVDFRSRFAWRLTLLLAMGYLHGLLYSGDILQVLALSGYLLIFAWTLSNRALLILALVFVLQVPQILKLLLMAGGMIGAGEPLHWSLMNQTFAIYAEGTFGEVMARNIWHGQLGKWLFMIESGRIWNVIGFFLVGFLLGRTRFFETYHRHLPLCALTLACALALLGVVHVGQGMLATVSWPQAMQQIGSGILGQYTNNLWTVCGVVLFVLAYRIRGLQWAMGGLAPCGRMSLTIYVSQSLYGVPLFYGFGLGLYTGLGQTNALILGLVLWSLQMVLAHAWMRRYRYGPLEWLWRAATYLTTDVPFRRPGQGS